MTPLPAFAVFAPFLPLLYRCAEKRRKKAKQKDIIRELGVRVGLGRKSRGSQEKGNLAG